MRRMAKPNICYHNVRLNLDNEQHCRVHRVLAALNTDIHKSVNQFIVDAVDSYISSLSCGGIVRAAGEQGDKERFSGSGIAGIREEMKNEIKNEIKDEIKNEIITLLASALGGGTARAAEDIMGRTGAAAETSAGAKEPDDQTMMDLVDGWG